MSINTKNTLRVLSLGIQNRCKDAEQARTGESLDVDEKNLAALAIAHQRGDQRSFTVLVNTLSRTLIAMAYRYTGDWEMARDLAQDTWVKVHFNIRRYDPGKSFRAWLLAVHRNGCLDHLRRAWVRYETTIGDEAIAGLRLVSGAGNPEEDLERREFHDHLLTALGDLSESQRQVFVRVDLEQKDQEEVAQALGIKYATLRTTLHFARKRLAALLRCTEEPL
jgi:RNA polymerase sigma factor (sigma-70 family)